MDKNKNILLSLATLLSLTSLPLTAQVPGNPVNGRGNPLTLWYLRPATRWTEASIIGNGRLGGMVWGGAKKERIDLNEDTLWSGEPYDNLNPNGLKSLPEIRRLLREGKNGEAQGLVDRDMCNAPQKLDRWLS